MELIACLPFSFYRFSPCFLCFLCSFSLSIKFLFVAQDTGLDDPPLCRSDLAELERHVSRVEEALHQKEEENVSLHDQLKQYEMRWLEYEANMRWKKCGRNSWHPCRWLYWLFFRYLSDWLLDHPLIKDSWQNVSTFFPHIAVHLCWVSSLPLAFISWEYKLAYTRRGVCV